MKKNIIILALTAVANFLSFINQTIMLSKT